MCHMNSERHHIYRVTIVVNGKICLKVRENIFFWKSVRNLVNFERYYLLLRCKDISLRDISKGQEISKLKRYLSSLRDISLVKYLFNESIVKQLVIDIFLEICRRYFNNFERYIFYIDKEISLYGKEISPTVRRYLS